MAKGLVSVLIISVLLFPFLCSAQEVYLPDTLIDELQITSRPDQYRDHSFSKSLPDLKKENFQKSEKVVADLGWGKFRAWLRLSVRSEVNQKLFIQVHNPVFDEIGFYVEGETYTSGLLTPIESRVVPFRHFIFPLEIKAGSAQEVYLSGISKLNPHKFPLRLLSQKGLIRFVERQGMLTGLALGFISFLILLSLLVYYFFRVRNFLIFTFSATCFGILYLFLEGYFFGRSYSAFLFDNGFLNTQYLIYYAFQIMNFWFYWSVFKIDFAEKTVWNVLYSLLLINGIVQGLVMSFSPLWYPDISDRFVRNLGLVIRIGAILANGFILAILLKNLKRRTLAVWFLVATIPGILAYGIPRFASFILEDVWITLPQLYLISMIWQVLIICLGLFKVNSIHYAQWLKPQELDAPAVVETIQNERIPTVLSSREHEILLAFANGFSYTEISDAFLISPHTVRTHIRNIYSKLEINSKAEAVRWVMEQGRD